MIQNYLTTANQLRAEANDILAKKEFWGVLQDSGKIIPCGSYYLDLLVWPDLDIYFEEFANEDPVEIFSNFMSIAAKYSYITKVKFAKELHIENPSLPKGVYLQFKLRFSKDSLWKIDIWSLEKDYQEDRLKDLYEIKEKLDLESRMLILRRKHELMGSNYRTPSLSSYYLYKAILDKKLISLEEIKQFIKTKGITI